MAYAIGTFEDLTEAEWEALVAVRFEVRRQEMRSVYPAGYWRRAYRWHEYALAHGLEAGQMLDVPESVVFAEVCDVCG